MISTSLAAARSAVALPMIGAGLVAVAAFGAYTVATIRAGGAAAVELQRLEEVAENNAKASRRYREGLAAVRRAEERARTKSAAAEAEYRKWRAAVNAMPPGERQGGICPIDCLIPWPSE